MTGRPVFVAQEPPSGGRTSEVGIFVGVVAGIAAAFISIAFDLPILLILPVAMLLAAFVAMQSVMRSHFKAKTGVVLCPRCRREPRNASGWCAACDAAVTSAQVAPDHPLHRMLAALSARDVATASQYVAPHVTSRMPNGRTASVSRAAWRRGAGMMLWLYRAAHPSIYTLHSDPAEPDMVWCRSQDSAKGRLFFPNLEGQTTTKYRFTDGLVSETYASEILPRASPKP